MIAPSTKAISRKSGKKLMASDLMKTPAGTLRCSGGSFGAMVGSMIARTMT